MTRIVSANDKSIEEAAALIKGGKLVAFPTETVYGLGANALDGRAVAGIFKAKGRPQFNPLIVHVADEEEAEKYVVFNEAARTLAQHFWPGPLTMILPRRAECKVSELASAGLPTLAVRAPSHKVARKLIAASGVPIAAPSANKSGEPSATAPAHVDASLDDGLELILAAGPCEVGLESTVIDLSGDKPVILRPGLVTAEDVAEVLGENIAYDFGDTDTPAYAGAEPRLRAGRPKSPGQLLKHYAPSIPVRLNAIDLEPGEALLAFGSVKFMGIKGGGAAKDLPESMIRNLSEAGDLTEAAANLFAMLRALDQPEHRGIAVMAIPETGLGTAINDRLKRASQS